MRHAKPLALLLAALVLLGVVPAFAGNLQQNPIVIHEVKHDVSLPLGVMAKLAPPPIAGSIIIREHPWPRHIFKVYPGPDPVVQTEYGPNVSTQNLLSFDGVDENLAGAEPRDTNGSAGRAASRAGALPLPGSSTKSFSM
jgi:hypothetical protein